ncbi:Cyclophilin peptidyl-prolyl cis-trans isomerase family protein isoform 1 [Spatholobus suberectus]|nr:Cyclophilin peptidyl-prolyl cis-trans isomerase family protein isoform 1 [Spatholobus suberectus]
MAIGASHMMLQCLFGGTISMNDMEVERRPYHKNCGCALHNLKDICSNVGHKQRHVSFPKKMSQIECQKLDNDKEGECKNG